MTKFLTLSRLEELYNCRGGHPNTFKYLIKDVKKKSNMKVRINSFVNEVFDLKEVGV